MKVKEYLGKEITVMACSDCNIKCKHCYIGYSGSFQRDTLFSLCNTLIKKYKVILNGTELLLHPEFFPIMQLVRQESLITNGIELYTNPSLINDIVSAGLKYVGISYHFNIHSSISTTNPDIIQPLLKLLKDSGIITEIRTTITTDNFNKIDIMCKEAFTMGAQGIKFTNCIKTGKAKTFQNSMILSRSQELYCLNEIEKSRSIYPKEKFLIRRCGTLGPGHFRKFYCPAGINSIVITPNMKIYPCIFMAQEGNEIGFVEDGKVMVNEEYYNDGTCCLARNMYNV